MSPIRQEQIGATTQGPPILALASYSTFEGFEVLGQRLQQLIITI